MSWKSRRAVAILAAFLVGTLGLQLAVAQKGRGFRPPVIEDPTGPPAAEALKTAKATGDAKQLADIMRRYLYTDAGAEATELLATALLDRGNYSAAALCFERLFRRSGPNHLSPMTLFKAAIAFQRA